MKFRQSGDRNGPGYGYLTVCTIYDKLYHILGAFFLTQIAWILVYALTLNTRLSLIVATIVVAIAGVIYELYQGAKNKTIELALRLAIPETAGPDEIAAVENRIARLDGFSWRDLTANCVGQSVVWLIYYILFVG